MNAWALTATNSTAPSYGTYCYPHDQIEGDSLYTCLGDLFSVSWMEYLEDNKNALKSMSLHDFYQQIKLRTSVKSEVLSFGATSIEQQQVNGVLFPKQPEFFTTFLKWETPQ
jgi:legumain